MKEMFKEVLQEALEAEMDAELGYNKHYASDKVTDNRRNGYSKKTIKSELGPIELNNSLPECTKKVSQCILSGKISLVYGSIKTVPCIGLK